MVTPLIIPYSLALCLAPSKGRFDPFFAKHTHRTYQVAVSDAALFDVIGAEASVDEYLSSFGSSPFVDNGAKTAERHLICCEVIVNILFFTFHI